MFYTVYPACGVIRIDLITKQDDGQLVSFVLQYFRNKACYRKFNDGCYQFKQTLAFDFGGGLVLARSLYVSVLIKDMYSSKEDTSSRTSYCHILEWSEEEMELVKCKDLIEMDLDGLFDQYSIPDVLPDPSGCTEFTRETYCKLWHDILFIEEQYIQREVKRYEVGLRLMPS